MPMPDRAPQPPRPDERHRHDLQTRVTVISGRSQLLRRRIARLSGVSQPEREALQAHVNAIDDATRSLSARIDNGPNP